MNNYELYNTAGFLLVIFDGKNSFGRQFFLKTPDR